MAHKIITRTSQQTIASWKLITAAHRHPISVIESYLVCLDFKGGSGNRPLVPLVVSFSENPLAGDMIDLITIFYFIIS